MNKHDELLARLDDWKTHTPTPTGISVIKSDVANAAAAIRALQAQLLNEKIMREAELSVCVEQLETERRARERLQTIFDEAIRIQGDDEALKYVTSLNSIPVTRCTVSADLIRQLVEGRRAAERKAYESANAFVEFRRTTYYLAIEHAEAAERQLAELREAVMVYLKAKCTESDHRRQSHYPSAPHETRRQYARLVPGDMDVTAAAEAALRKLVEDK